MPILESQLEGWSQQGSISTAKKTHESIRAALDRYEWPKGKPEVYLQGSYKNSTNIPGDSDVDVVVQLNSVLMNNLTAEQKRRFGFVKSNYTWNDFYSDVERALTDYYGASRVRRGRKTLKVQTPYLPADVVVCLQYRKYPPNPRSEDDYIEGMSFYVPSEGRWVINYPKLHYQNGATKNQKTNERYKPTIRMFKNARTYLIKQGAPQDLAPSYFLECLLYNVPDSKFGGTFQDTFCSVVKWLLQTDLSWFRCQNEQDDLFGDSPEQWSEEKARRFLKFMVHLWNH
ncbi:MAG: nucleotidyltransferase [Gammaproteobacteria bacterium]|nr:MAG: nucleotidyltransferase [Gammaproteobacteria bacterium]